MNSSELVKLEVTDQIALVSLNRADKHNALNMEMFYAIKKVISQIKWDKKIRVVIVKGNGSSFCSGLDIKSVMLKPTNGLKLLWKWWPFNPNLAQIVTIGWRKLNVPVIMALHGKCWGGGMQIALGGDYRIASHDSSFSIMEAKWGLIPDMGGTPALQESVPLDKAMIAAMTADEYSAEQALLSNLISQIAEDPIHEAYLLAEKLKSRSPDSNKLIKRLYLKTWSNGQGRLLARESYNQWKILLGKNQKIAVKKALGNVDVDYVE